MKNVESRKMNKVERNKEKQNRITLAVFHGTGILLAVKATDRSWQNNPLEEDIVPLFVLCK